MGAGKSAIGRRLAARLGLPFADVDLEIERAAGLTIEDIFETYGEPAFRDVERRVVARLLGEAPHVISTGGGAFMDLDTRQIIAERGISLWLRADLDLLVARTGRRQNRPLLKQGNRREILQRLMTERYPVYGPYRYRRRQPRRPSGRDRRRRAFLPGRFPRAGRRIGRSCSRRRFPVGG